MERTRLDVYEKLPSGMEKYLAEHGWNFSKKLCEYAVSKMKDRNGNKIHCNPISIRSCFYLFW